MSNDFRIVNNGYNFLVVSPDGDIVERCHNRATAVYYQRKARMAVLDAEAKRNIDAMVDRCLALMW